MLSLHVIATHADAVFLVFFWSCLSLQFFTRAALFLYLFVVFFLLCFVVYLTSDPCLSDIKGGKPPAEACWKVRSCDLYWKTVYLSLVHTEF